MIHANIHAKDNNERLDRTVNVVLFNKITQCVTYFTQLNITQMIILNY